MEQGTTFWAWHGRRYVFPAGGLMMFRRLILTSTVSACLAFGGVVASHAQNLSSHEYEYQLKATFLYNFARFVDWPESSFRSPTSPLVVCVLGEDPFGAALDAIDGKNIGDRKVEIRRLSGTSGLGACQVLFISSSERDHVTQILDSLRNSNTLTIGEMSKFTRDGGIVEVELRRNRIHFTVNIDAAQQAGIMISSRVLQLATVVNYAQLSERR